MADVETVAAPAPTRRRFEAVLPFLEWTRRLDGPTVRADLVAGITAGVLILPQAVALATLAGMPPEYGLYTSIFPVIIVALFGSSWHSLSGPNTALAILIFIDLSTFASRSTEDYITYALGLTFMAGAFQLAFGALRLGMVFNFISHSVITGMVAGVGIIIIIQQLGNFFGLIMNSREEIYETLMQVYFNLNHANWYAAAAGAATVVSGALIRRYRRHWPHLIIAVIVGTLAAWLLDGLYGSANTRIDKLGNMTLSAFPFQFVDFSPDTMVVLRELVPSAVLIALLGLMQSAVIARSLAVKSGQQVNMNQEIIGQGLSNVAGSYLSCFASCGSFNRSAANLEAGARTPLAGLISAFALALLVVVAAPLIALMPIAVMAGVLFLVGYSLIDAKEIKRLVNVREELAIFFVCLFVTLVFGLDYAVFVGVLLSVIVYFRNVYNPDFVRLSAAAALDYTPPGAYGATVLRIAGNLFFGSVFAVERELRRVADSEGRARTLVLIAEQLGYLDTAGAQLIAKEAGLRRHAGGELHLWLSEHSRDKLFEESGLREALGADHIHFRSAYPTSAVQSAPEERFP